MKEAAVILLAGTILAGCATSYPELPPAPMVAPEPVSAIEHEPAPRDMHPREGIGGAQSYVWREDREFPIYAPVGQTLPVSFVKGERINDVTLTDHFGWNNTVVAYGSGRSETPVLVVTAVPGEARPTTAIVTTSKRLYLLKLTPRGKGYKSARFHAPQAAQPAMVARSAGVRQYTLQGPRTSWRPIRVTDDGAQTVVELPASAGAMGMPTVVGVNSDGTERPLNARRSGNSIVADGVFEIIRVRLGEQRIDARRL